VAASVLVATVAVTLTLVGVLGLGRIAIRVAATSNPALRTVATLAEIVAGIVWLLGTVFLATRLAALIFIREPTKTERS
jgi:hypothetical protein